MPTLKRRFRKAIGSDRWKGLAMTAFEALLREKHVIPRGFFEAIASAAGALLRAYWHFPLNPWRGTIRAAIAIGARGRSPSWIYSNLVDATISTGLGFLQAHVKGVDSVLPRIRFAPGSREKIESMAARYGRGIIVIPHCVGGIFSAALFARKFPTLILSKGPKNQRRADVQRRFMEPLGLNLLVLDRNSAVAAARQFMKALKEGHFIVGTCDLDYRRDDSLPSTMFGLEVNLPSWPARFARQAKAPIIPGYAAVEGGRVTIIIGDPIVERDLEKATRAWAAAFERFILNRPWDWAFLADLKWGRNLRRSARSGWRIDRHRPPTQPSLEKSR